MNHSNQPRLVGALTLCALITWTAADARAAFITSAGDLLGSTTVVDFDQFTDPFVNTGGPVQIGGSVGEDITFESIDQNFNPGGGLIGTGYHELETNGYWDEGRGGYTALSIDVGAMTYRFHDGPVSGVVAFINYDPRNRAQSSSVEILAADDSVIESVVLDSGANPDAEISTPDGVNAGAFRGFQRDQADIFAFRVTNQILVLDDLTFVRPEVPVIPEPSSLVLAGVGLASLGAMAVRRRRRRASTA